MATYVIGDIQGCFITLQNLLKAVRFDAASDRLWCVGDLVNRGPSSHEVLRFAKSLRDRFLSVLGNHDLHLITRSLGISHSKKRDTLLPLLKASDLPELIDWLRHCPLTFQEDNSLLVHAGLHPCWTLKEAEGHSMELEKGLRGEDWKGFLRDLFHPENQSPLRDALQIFTRTRMCHENGDPDFHYTGPPEEAPPWLLPWYAHPLRQIRGPTLLFGHWAALGFRMEKDWISLDSGCVWGKKLTAVRLEDRAVFQQNLLDPILPV